MNILRRCQLVPVFIRYASNTSKRILKNSNIPYTQIKVVMVTGMQATSLTEAMGTFDRKLFDLILVDSNQNPPVCKIVSKKEQHDAKKPKTPVRKFSLKEMEFNSHIGIGDFQVKVNKCLSFLSKGDHVKITLFDKGGQQLAQMMKEIAEQCSSVGKISGTSVRLGKKLIFTINSKTKTKK